MTSPYARCLHHPQQHTGSQGKRSKLPPRSLGSRTNISTKNFVFAKKLLNPEERFCSRKKFFNPLKVFGFPFRNAFCTPAKVAPRPLTFLNLFSKVWNSSRVLDVAAGRFFTHTTTKVSGNVFVGCRVYSRPSVSGKAGSHGTSTHWVSWGDVVKMIDDRHPWISTQSITIQIVEYAAALERIGVECPFWRKFWLRGVQGHDEIPEGSLGEHQCPCRMTWTCSISRFVFRRFSSCP